jgi:hypothetical protein
MSTASTDSGSGSRPSSRPSSGPGSGPGTAGVADDLKAPERAEPKQEQQKERQRQEVHHVVDWSRHLTKAADGPRAYRVGGLEEKKNWPDETWIVADLLTPAICRSLIEAAEHRGFGRTNYDPAYRGNTRLQVTDLMLAKNIWRRLRPLVPAQVERLVRKERQLWRAVGLNERWRLAKYWPADRFERHIDAPFVRSPTEISLYTVNIYLNGPDATEAGLPVFTGGATRLFTDVMAPRAPTFSVRPKPGMALVFRQPPDRGLLHDGERVASGVKYLLRTDVMYVREV